MHKAMPEADDDISEHPALAALQQLVPMLCHFTDQPIDQASVLQSLYACATCLNCGMWCTTVRVMHCYY